MVYLFWANFLYRAVDLFLESEAGFCRASVFRLLLVSGLRNNMLLVALLRRAHRQHRTSASATAFLLL